MTQHGMMTNDELLNRFAREYQDFHGISTARKREQCKRIREFAEQIAPRSLTEAEGSDLTQYMAALLEAGQHANTVRKKANMIRPLYSWAYGARLIDAETFTRIRVVENPRGAVTRGRPRPYSQDEIQRLFAELDARYEQRCSDFDRVLRNYLLGRTKFRGHIKRHAWRLQLEAIVVLALHGALRKGEIGRLELVDMHYDNLYVMVRSARKNRHGEEYVREVPMTDAMRTPIRAWLEFRAMLRPEHTSPWLALETSGGHDPLAPMSPRALKLLLHSRVGPGWELHRLRHTCGTERLRSGMPIEKLKDFMGHADIQETLGYAKIVKTDIYRSIAATDEDFTKRVSRRAA